MSALGIENGVVAGQSAAWSLIQKLGEGDAGEVYLVEGLVTHEPAILKRPRRSVFLGEIRRQAEQIRTEGRILQALEHILKPLQGRVSTPRLLDVSKPGTEFSENQFIVIARANGFDLTTLTRVAQMGFSPAEMSGYTPAEQTFLRELAKQGAVPERVLLAALAAVLDVFALIHTTEWEWNNQVIQGILWNDVKPDHLFWNPYQTSVTLIDWGNGRLIEKVEGGREARYSPVEDLRQFWEEMSRFLWQVNPALLERLEWSTALPNLREIRSSVEVLRQRIERLRLDAERQARQLREEEARLLSPTLGEGLLREALEDVQARLIALGEIPDYESALRMAGSISTNLAAVGDMESIRAVCRWAESLPGSQSAMWQVIAHLAEYARRADPAHKEAILQAVQRAAAGQWEEVLWYMLVFLENAPEPDNWQDLVEQVRALALPEDALNVRPLPVLKRILFTLQTTLQRLEDQKRADEEEGLALRTLVEQLQAVAYNWVQVDPLPPHTTITYQDAETLITDIEHFLPGAGNDLRRALTPLRRQVQDVLESWGRREFILARQGLRRLLALDPDRRRLLRAESVLEKAPHWLQQLHGGPQAHEHLSECITRWEYEGREMRNQVGSAGWLDGILEGLKAIRRGTWPGDLLLSQPELVADLPWLTEFERAEEVQKRLYPHMTLRLPLTLQGIQETRFGPEQALSFLEPIDAWTPEARGSSARVYRATYLAGNGEQQEAALKIMRMDKAEYALPLFREEARILSILEGVPGVNPMLECGFLWVGEGFDFPPDHNLGAIQALRGDAVRMGVERVDTFLEQLDQRVREGWAPYLLVQTRRREDNLLLMCDASVTQGRLLPVPQLLLMSIQICEILEEAHRRNIVYRDHKILHYYWEAPQNGIYVIDWNVARYYPEGLTPVEIHMDLVQLGARGLHHILTGRPAPGALPLGPTRPEEIEQAAQQYRAQWTFDDQRLSAQVLTILEQLLSGSYTSVSDLKDDLKRAYLDLR